MLHRPCVDGEPQWADCRRGGDPRIRPCRAAGGGTLDRAARRAASTHHCRRRQGLRQCGLHRRDARDQRHPARLPAPLRHRWPHHAPCRLRRQHQHPKTHRGSLRLRQDRGWAAQGTSSRTSKIDWQFTFAMAAYNLIRLPKLFIGPASHSNTTHAPTANSNSYPQQPPTGNSPSGRKTSYSTVIFSSLPENAAAAPAANAIGRDGPPLAASSISLAPCQADSAEWHVLRDVTDVAASHRVIVDPPGFDDPPRD